MRFVGLEEARADRGLRLVVAGTVPSPWSEAAKGLCALGKLDVKLVRHAGTAAADINAWTGTDNVPVLFSGVEPARTSAAAIVGLLSRLAPSLVPVEPAARADVMGWIDVIAGDCGIGWNARLAVIHAGLESNGERGFPARVSAYLAPRYGYDAARMATVDADFGAQVAALAARLGESEYFGGDQANALDVYSATFLTILQPISEADCPALHPRIRAAFASAVERLGARVPAALFAHRRRMFEGALPWPIAL